MHYVQWDIDREWRNLRWGGIFVEADVAVLGFACTISSQALWLSLPFFEELKNFIKGGLFLAALSEIPKKTK